MDEQQEEIDRERACGDDLPHFERVALHQRPPARRGQGPAGATLQGQQELLGGFEAILGLAGHRLEQDVLEPAGDFRAPTCQADRLAEFRLLERFDLAIGIFSGQQVVKGNTCSIKVEFRGGRRALMLFRRNVRRRASRADRFVGLALAEAERDPEIEDTQRTICLLYTSPSPRDRTRSRMPSSA